MKKSIVASALIAVIVFVVASLFVISYKIAVAFWALFFSVAIAKTIVIVLNIVLFLIGLAFPFIAIKKA